jgi:hypothetical protein
LRERDDAAERAQYAADEIDAEEDAVRMEAGFARGVGVAPSA